MSINSNNKKKNRVRFIKKYPTAIAVTESLEKNIPVAIPVPRPITRPVPTPISIYISNISNKFNRYIRYNTFNKKIVLDALPMLVFFIIIELFVKKVLSYICDINCIC